MSEPVESVEAWYEFHRGHCLRWVPVEEALPRTVRCSDGAVRGMKVYVIVEMTHPTLRGHRGWEESMFDGIEWDINQYGGKPTYEGRVTHWMPFPLMPVTAESDATGSPR